MRMLRLALICVMGWGPYSAYAAAITSNGTGGGAFETGASWVGGVAPGGSDTFTVASGDTITCSDARSTLGATITGTLTIADGCTWTVDGNTTGSGTLRINNGGTMQLEATTAARTINVTNIMMRGTSGARALIQSVNGTNTTNGYFAASAAGKNTLDIQYGKFYRVGSSSNINEFRGASETVDHLECDTCGRLSRATEGDQTGTISWNAVTVKNTLPSASIVHNLAAGKAATYTNVVVDKQWTITGTPTGTVTMTNIISETLTALGGASTHGLTNLVASNIMGTTVPASMQYECYCRGDINGFYFYQPTSASPKHFIDTYDYPAGTLDLHGGIAEFAGSVSYADVLVPNNTGTSSWTANVYDNIVLENGTGTSDRCSSSLVNLARGIQYSTWNIHDNTLCITAKTLGSGSIAIMEGSNKNAIGRAGAITAIKDNLGFSTSATYPGVLVHPVSSRRDSAWRLIDSGTVTSATATSLADTTVNPTWSTEAGGNTLFADNPGAYVRITTVARQQVVSITGQVSATELSVAAWTNGTPQVGDAYEIFMVDMVTASNTNYNGFWNGQAGTIYRPDTSATTVATTGYMDYYITSGAPGANDVTGDPGFTDSTRRLSTWDTSLGGAGTAANAITELKKMNDDSGYNSAYTIAAAIAYVRAGFVPSNTAFRAGSTGNWIGAVDGPAGGCASLLLMGAGC